jgi:hypothetical protein
MIVDGNSIVKLLQQAWNNAVGTADPYQLPLKVGAPVFLYLSWMDSFFKQVQKKYQVVNTKYEVRNTVFFPISNAEGRTMK